MKQVLQSLKTGITEVAEVPCPRAGQGALLIRSLTTLVSAGTERMLVDFGKANLIDKARQQPDKVRMVLDKVKTDGLLPTLEAVRNKLDQPLAMGYCNVGVVMELGGGVTGFKAGERVASNGKHAEVVSVTVNLCARRGPGSGSTGLFPWARRGCSAHYRFHREQRAGAPGRADVPQARAHRAGRCHGA